MGVPTSWEGNNVRTNVRSSPLYSEARRADGMRRRVEVRDPTERRTGRTGLLVPKGHTPRSKGAPKAPPCDGVEDRPMTAGKGGDNWAEGPEGAIWVIKSETLGTEWGSFGGEARPDSSNLTRRNDYVFYSGVPDYHRSRSVRVGGTSSSYAYAARMTINNRIPT